MNGPTLVVAHRGDHSAAVENTLPAFEAAMRRGADMIEFDVRRTADGELVVHHDDAVDGRRLAGLAYDEALRVTGRLGYAIPRVRELLELVTGRVRLDVELKEAGCEDAVLRLLFEHRVPVTEVVITSFDAAILARVTEASPGARTGLLVDDMTGAEALDRFRAHPVDFLAPDHVLLDAPTLAAAERDGIALVPWTVNDPAAMRRLLRAPTVTGIITDRLVEALHLRRQASAARGGPGRR